MKTCSIAVFFCWVLSLPGLSQQLTSPYRITPGDAWLASGTLLLAGGGLYAQSRVQAFSPAALTALNTNDVPRIDRSNLGVWRPGVAKASNVAMLAVGAMPLAIFAGREPRKDILKIALMGAEAGLTSLGLVDLTKGLVHRTRPFMYGQAAPLDEKLKQDARLSFFSGHTAFTATACFFGAKLFHDYFPESKLRPWVWAAAALVPAGMGYLRMRAGKHFLTDVATGYLVGGAVGYLVPLLHRTKLSRSLSVMPDVWKGGSGVVVNWRF